jgi:hypothetical protein
MHPLVHQVVSTYLSAADREAPGLIEGLYLTGSVVLADFRPLQSDIDFVAVTANRPDALGRAALSRAHAYLQRRHRRPLFEGVYVTWEDLTREPSMVAPAPSVHGGRFHEADRFALNPVTWHTLAKHGVACRGPATTGISVWADPKALAVWTLGNLDSYWRRWCARHSPLFSRAGLASLGTWAPSWGVLGASRLHYTLTTGAITSKDAAGIYALERFPEPWHRVVKECLRIHRDESVPSLYRSPLARRKEALAFMSMAIDDAHRLDSGEHIPAI